MALARPSSARLKLSIWRRMYLFPRFLDPERAEHVVQMARSRLAPSALALRKGDKESEKS